MDILLLLPILTTSRSVAAEPSVFIPCAAIKWPQYSDFRRIRLERSYARKGVAIREGEAEESARFSELQM